MTAELRILWHCIFAAGFFCAFCQKHFAFTISPDSFHTSQTAVSELYNSQTELSEFRETNLMGPIKDGVQFFKTKTRRQFKTKNAPDKHITVNPSGHLVIKDWHQVRTDTSEQPVFHHITQTTITEIFEQPQLFGTLTALISTEDNLQDLADNSTLTASAFTMRENMLILILTFSVLVIGTFLASPQRQKMPAKAHSKPHRGDLLEQ